MSLPDAVHHQVVSVDRLSSLLFALPHPRGVCRCQECDTLDGDKIYFEDFLRIVTEENKTAVTEMNVRAALSPRR